MCKAVILLIDLIMITRPVVLIPVWGFGALGMRAAITTDFDTGFRQCWSILSPPVYLLLFVFSLSVASVYVINQLADIEADKKNGGLPLIASGIVSKPASVVVLILCALVSLIVPLFMQQPLIVLVSFLSIILGIVYSIKPLRFSGRPILDFISNATGYGILAFGAGWITAGKSPFTLHFITASLPYFFLMAAGSISSTLPDITGDKEDDKITTAVAFGKKKAHCTATSFLLLAIISGLLARDSIAIFCAAASLPIYISYFILSNKTHIMEATYKVGGGICMIAAFLAIPGFLFLSIIVFFIALLYFRLRHNVHYPSLSPVK